jgi:hypothetical protein
MLYLPIIRTIIRIPSFRHPHALSEYRGDGRRRRDSIYFLTVMRTLRRAVRVAATIPIFLYQKVVSPAIPNRCIYAPTCSHYGREAILAHGIFKGFLLLLSRVFRCSGLFAGGYDPVPEEFSFRGIGRDYRKRWRRDG